MSSSTPPLTPDSCTPVSQVRPQSGAPRWTTCVGMGGRHASEWVDGMDRNRWTTCVGISTVCGRAVGLVGELHRLAIPEGSRGALDREMAKALGGDSTIARHRRCPGPGRPRRPVGGLRGRRSASTRNEASRAWGHGRATRSTSPRAGFRSVAGWCGRLGRDRLGRPLLLLLLPPAESWRCRRDGSRNVKSDLQKVSLS